MYKINNFKTIKSIREDLEKFSYDPDSISNLLLSVEKYVNSKNYELALDTLHRVIEIHGATSETLLNIALCNYYLQDIEQAIHSLEESLELDPDNEQSVKLLEKLKEKLKQLRDYTMVIYG